MDKFYNYTTCNDKINKLIHNDLNKEDEEIQLEKTGN